MSEVNWDDNAIAAVKAFHWWLGSDDNCGLEIDETLGKFMEKVVARKATKTVEDAVEWAHTYSDYGVRKDCILVHDKPDIHGQVLVVNRYDEYVLTGTVELKPIKPKLTKAQAWDKICESEHEFDIVNRIKQLYDII